MELQFYGANCVKITLKKATLTFDDNLTELGAKAVTKNGEVALFSGAHALPEAEVKMVIDQPGEYEVSDVSISGVAARAHTDEAGKRSATMYKIAFDDVRAVVLGHVYPELSEEQLEALGTVDILFVPVGGNGYTLDPIGALKLIKAIEPKLVIPTHYAESGLNYPVPQKTLEEALKELGMEVRETVPKLKLKAGEFSDATQLVVLERQ